MRLSAGAVGFALRIVMVGGWQCALIGAVTALGLIGFGQLVGWVHRLLLVLIGCLFHEKRVRTGTVWIRTKIIY